MSKPRILLQLDGDPHASVFDAVTAIDAEVDRLLQQANVQPDQVRDLVHGCIFTRSPQDLKSTAIFVGGSNVAAGEELLRQVVKSFFGPMRVSVMLDANGANTTAAAAVLAAARHVNLAESTVLVLGGTGPVGQRVARLAARKEASVRIASRSLERAKPACQAVNQAIEKQLAAPVAVSSPADLPAALKGVQVVISAGAAGIELLPLEQRKQADALQIVIDLNAVPPLGIAGVEATDKAAEREGVIAYGAVGVGGTKMKIHKAALRKLFEANDLVLDAEEIYAVGESLE